MKRLLTGLAAIALAATVAGCGGGLSENDQALCDRVDSINPYMDTQGVSGDDTSAASVFAALQGADNEKLAQVGRDYTSAGDIMQYSEYEERAQRICE